MKALVGAFSVIVKTGCETDGSFYSTNLSTAVLGVNKFRNAAMLYPSLSPRTNLFLCACVCVYYPEENEAVNTQWNGD